MKPRPKGLMELVREHAKLFPEWTDISDFLPAGYQICGKERRAALKIGCLLRSHKKRVQVTLAPGRTAVIPKQPTTKETK